MPLDEGTLMMDAETFLGSNNGPGDFANRRTFGVLFKGPQLAGTPVSYTVLRDCSLVQVVGSPANVFILRAPNSWNAGTFLQLGVAVGLSSVGGQSSHGNFKFLAGDQVWLDSGGGIGSGEFVFLIFALDNETISDR